MKIVISILFIITIGVIGFLYVKISNPKVEVIEPKIEIEPLKFKEETIKQPKVYNLAARVVNMRIDLRNYRYIAIYRVILDIKDKFSIFNIKAILNSFNVIYSSIENKNGARIYIAFRNKDEAQKILNLFKNYGFNATIQKIKQRI